MSSSASVLKRVAIAAGAAAIGFSAFGSTAAVASQPAGVAIDTYPAWDGSTFIQPFGCPETSNYGETVTIPKGKHHITKLTFAWTDLGTGQMDVRAEVYAWDAASQHATGSALGESAVKTVVSGTSGFYDETFKIKTSKLKPGQQYVAFATIDKDYENCTNNYTVGWGAITDDSAYPGGTFVYQNSEGDESQWTTAPWNSFGWDLALKVSMKK